MHFSLLGNGMCLGLIWPLIDSPSPNSYQPNPKNPIRFDILSLKGERSFDWKQQSHCITLQLFYYSYQLNLNTATMERNKKHVRVSYWQQKTLDSVRLHEMPGDMQPNPGISFCAGGCSIVVVAFKNSVPSAKMQAGTVNCVFIKSSWITFWDTCLVIWILSKFCSFPACIIKCMARCAITFCTHATSKKVLFFHDFVPESWMGKISTRSDFDPRAPRFTIISPKNIIQTLKCSGFESDTADRWPLNSLGVCVCGCGGNQDPYFAESVRTYSNTHVSSGTSNVYLPKQTPLLTCYKTQFIKRKLCCALPSIV